VRLESARHARHDAQELRLQSSVLRLAARREVAMSHARVAGARAVSARGRTAGVPSPWSELSWRLDDESLDQILVPLD
jgi:hypothetical protein